MYGNTATTEGTFEVSYTQTFKAGTEEVKSSKGNKTKHVEGSESNRVLLDQNITNSLVNNNYHVVAGSNKTGKTTISFAYPVYSTKVTAGTLSEETLIYSNDRTVTVKPGVAKISFPATYHDVKIYEHDASGSNWLDGTSTWEKLTLAENDSDAKRTINGNKVNYQVWKRINDMPIEGSDHMVRFTFDR